MYLVLYLWINLAVMDSPLSATEARLLISCVVLLSRRNERLPWNMPNWRPSRKGSSSSSNRPQHHDPTGQHLSCTYEVESCAK